MSCLSFPERLARLLALGALMLAGVVAQAAPPAVLPFGADTWAELTRTPRHPLAVVFSTTDCTHCPAVIESLGVAVRKSGSKARLVVVVMDGAGQEAALRGDRHYRPADALYAFSGDAIALRYRVNPDWRGLTPYVALVPVQDAPRFFSGAPPAGALRNFLRP